METGRLTPHFSLAELTRSHVALRGGIDNTPPPERLPALRYLAEQLEVIRTLLGGVPLHITSGYRCPALNRAVGGSRRSRHMLGLAADFVAPEFGTPLEIARHLVQQGKAFDQLIHEGHWVHFAAPRRPLRPEGRLLTARFGPGGVRYEAGLDEG